MKKEGIFREISWDIESNGFYWDSTELWCIGVTDIKSGIKELFTNYDPAKRSLGDGVAVLEQAELWAGHNLIGFDIPVMEKLIGRKLSRPEVIIDTWLTSQVLYPRIQDTKFAHRVPKKINWSHSLEAWGLRVGQKKGDYNEFDKYTKAMGDYCLQDTTIPVAMLSVLKERAELVGVPWDFNDITKPLGIEHAFKDLITRQEITGFPFNRAAAEQLASPLMAELENINSQLQVVFPPITEVIEYETKVKKIKKTKEVTTVFNPGSRPQVGQRLMALGWEPGSFTPTGLPVINEDTMAAAAEVIPEAKLIDRYFTLNKMVSTIVHGDSAWLRLERNGKMHGQVQTLGSVTTRVRHSKPNMSQVPRVGSFMGKECRSLFGARDGWRLVGADLSGIELRCLAHYLHRWDGGEYTNHVLTGDVHTVHQQAFGLPEGKHYRNVGKGGTYCLSNWGR